MQTKRYLSPNSPAWDRNLGNSIDVVHDDISRHDIR